MSITSQTSYVIKTKEELDKFAKEYDKNFPLTILRKSTEEETSKVIIKMMTQKLIEMEEYHEKNWKEFERSHIKNYIQKMMNARIKAKYWKDFFDILDNKNL